MDILRDVFVCTNFVRCLRFYPHYKILFVDAKTNITIQTIRETVLAEFPDHDFLGKHHQRHMRLYILLMQKHLIK